MKLDPVDNNFFLDATKEMTRFIRRSKTSIVIVIGTSAQTTAYHARKHWGELYPNVKPPVFIAVGRVKRGADGKFFAVPTGALLDEELEKAILERGKKHFGDKKEKIFLLEESVNNGITTNRVKAILHRAGMKNVLAGALIAQKGNRAGLDFAAAVVPLLGPEMNDKVFHRWRREATNKLIIYREEMARAMKENPKFAKEVKTLFREKVRVGHETLGMNAETLYDDLRSKTGWRKGMLVTAAHEALSARKKLKNTRRR